MTLCDKYPTYPTIVQYYIQLLYFVRASIFNYINELGYDKPSDILFAQLHHTISNF
jgi:hypothetical protein